MTIDYSGPVRLCVLAPFSSLVLVVRLVLAPGLVVVPNDQLVGLGVRGCGIGAGNTLGVGGERRNLEALGAKPHLLLGHCPSWFRITESRNVVIFSDAVKLEVTSWWRMT